MRHDLAGIFWDDTPPPKVVKEEVVRVPPPRTWEEPGYLPGLDEARRFNVPQYTQWEELEEAAKTREPHILDIEVFQNYFLACFTSYITGKVIYFEIRDGFIDAQRIRWILENFLIVGFNSEGYDLPMLTLALQGYDCAKLKEYSDAIIVYQVKHWQLLKGLKVKKLKVDHIDLIEVAPLQGSLKLYAGRLHAPKLQDLPFNPNAILSDDQKTIVRFYCVNDTYNTAWLFKELSPQVELRAKMSNIYGIDLRSDSDAQLAEAVIGSELTRHNYGEKPGRVEIPPGTLFNYKVPDFMRFETPQLQNVLNVVRMEDFVVTETGYVALPVAIDELKIEIAGATYQMGLGGLHSNETAQAVYSDKNYKIVDRDVTSYYPQIILNQKLYPKHLGPQFLEIYSRIVSERVAAKKAKDKMKADMFKIVVNGSFGKFGNKYSILYSPDLLIQTTMSGQLCLLMLIERLHLAGAVIVSANTDGVIYKYERHKETYINHVVEQWEALTGLTTEATPYLGVFSRDVNNYVAVKEDRSFKVKGEFSERGSAADSILSKNPVNLICNDALVNFLTKGTPISQTVRSCQDVRRFTSLRQVRGGAVKNGDYLGKVIRYYYAQGETGEIVYAVNGHKVPDSDGAKPLMALPDSLPADLDFARYESISYEMLASVGFPMT